MVLCEICPRAAYTLDNALAWNRGFQILDQRPCLFELVLFRSAHFASDTMFIKGAKTLTVEDERSASIIDLEVAACLEVGSSDGVRKFLEVLSETYIEKSSMVSINSVLHA
eukprot:TRINITY_DN55774_c0_g1_i1.p1 TRINITY_DN55774_c0_g1~~TRINITY_DN55774_c0_g1_i1.p1  ORF type:complete len:111 (+),score=5.65 TRINITY_DN55774_c0_g1_i1:118-450(+)